MIDKFDKEDLDQVMEIWIKTNLSAHSFVSASFWLDNYDDVRELLPQSDIFVYRDNNDIKGFVGVSDNQYIAGIFVSEDSQGLGIGGELLDYCKGRYKNLRLDVYKKNTQAIKFYQNHGFSALEEKLHEDTCEMELFMEWKTQE